MSTHLDHTNITELLTRMVDMAARADRTFTPVNARKRPSRNRTMTTLVYRASLIPRGVRWHIHRMGIGDYRNPSQKFMAAAIGAFPGIAPLFDADAGAVWGTVYLLPPEQSALFGIRIDPLPVDPRESLACFANRIGCRHFHSWWQAWRPMCLIWPPVRPQVAEARATVNSEEWDI